MFGALFKIPEEELDRALERVLANTRVQALLDRLVLQVTEMLLDRLLAGLRAKDKESDDAVPP